MAVTIGVIAEAENDIEVLYEFTCKLTSESNFSFKQFIAGGCGKLRRKCEAWSLNLIQSGCSHLVVMHDLDNHDERELRKQLQSSVSNAAFEGHLILIPIYETEAWLLSDSLALKQTFAMRRLPKVPGQPETVRDPKEHLRDIVWKSCKKRYVNAIHNKKIAKATRISKLSVCPSFALYPQFVAAHVTD